MSHNFAQFLLFTDISFNSQIVYILLVHTRASGSCGCLSWPCVLEVGSRVTYQLQFMAVSHRNRRHWPNVLFMPFILFSAEAMTLYKLVMFTDRSVFSGKLNGTAFRTFVWAVKYLSWECSHNQMGNRNDKINQIASGREHCSNPPLIRLHPRNKLLISPLDFLRITMF